ncbi:MAG TPA: electron transfer flavoprotein subunit beta/FixA family protein [Thermoanaerobaculia bacterium]|jgi:electron transfer flavoprotein beta subunit|nr:electron transfer flavoprotein subunit beta/FixA family protein [Thermoanaerobaculia bacterium]
MKIAVCIKQVPDTEARLRLNKQGTWIEEEDLPFVINESDECALEEALQIRDKSGGGEVVVFSLGPERVREALRKALALGADRAAHLHDPAFSLGDPVATARALAAAVGREPFDLVLTGSQSDDLGWGVTASLVAARLGLPHAWLVMGIEVENGGGSARVVREMEAGKNEIFRLRLPAVLEVQAGINHPRYASLKGIMQAKRKEIATLSRAEIGLAEGEAGAAGSRVEILKVDFPRAGTGARILEGDVASTASQLVELLRAEARVL